MNEKLYLGCGPLPIHRQHLQIIDDSWVLIDLHVKSPGIVNMDARHLEYPDNSVSKIYNSHLLEHFGIKDVLPTLKEWYRALKSNGELITNVPDIEWASEQILVFSGALINQIGKNSSVFNTGEKIMEVIYGNQDHDGEYHKSGFTKNILQKYLELAGFKKITVKKIYDAHEMNCLIARAIKI